jgi:hypothetical protein
VPGLYCAEGPNGWPGNAIEGSGGFCVEVIVGQRESSKLFADLKSQKTEKKAS